MFVLRKLLLLGSCGLVLPSGIALGSESPTLQGVDPSPTLTAASNVDSNTVSNDDDNLNSNIDSNVNSGFERDVYSSLDEEIGRNLDGDIKTMAITEWSESRHPLSSSDFTNPKDSTATSGIPLHPELPPLPSPPTDWVPIAQTLPSSESKDTEQPKDTEEPSAEKKPVETPEEAPEETPDPKGETPSNLPAKNLSPEEQARYQKLVEADRLYRQGDRQAATRLYQEVKSPFLEEQNGKETAVPDAIHDPAKLPPGGQVYWREGEAGLTQGVQTQTLVPLQLLVDQYPQFIPGHLRLAATLERYDRPDEASAVIAKGVQQYPNEPTLVKAQVESLVAQRDWVGASVAARQFALLNQAHPEAETFSQLADTHMERYRKSLRRKLRGRAIASVLTGAVGYAVTGGLLGPLSSVETTVLLLQGESSIGNQYTKALHKRLEMVDDPEIVGYVNELGQKLVQVAGRKEFEYEFFVVMDDRLNAFALPGGKVFVNLGAIAKTESEAELAGLLAHEISHATLSHGFQLMTQGSLFANLGQFVPLGGTAANFVVLDYSRDMERQADAMGTTMLSATGYAADGLRNLMVTLGKENRSSRGLSWMSTHPDTDKRVRTMEQQILRSGYNRYAYEGVERHQQIRERSQSILEGWKSRQGDRPKRNR